jgi:hypothetical protein
MVRTPDAGRVRAVPDAAAIARITEQQPGTIVRVAVQPGQHLHELQGQDQYSFELAQAFIGASDQLELVEKYHAVLAGLGFDIARDRQDVVIR